jgi:hypothetical protein
MKGSYILINGCFQSSFYNGLCSFTNNISRRDSKDIELRHVNKIIKEVKRLAEVSNHDFGYFENG